SILGAVSQRRGAFTAQALQPLCSRTGNDKIGLFGYSAFESPRALQNEAARLARESSDDPFKSHEGGRALTEIHHQILDLSLTLDVARVGLGNRRASELGHVDTLAVGLLVPVLDDELRVGTLLHGSPLRPGWE